MRGDLLLSTSSGKWYERLIVQVTHGPYVHVAIQLTEQEAIAAGPSGIALFPFSEGNPHCILLPLPSLTGAQKEAGLLWATSQVGKAYGWMDIGYQAFKFCFPNNPFRFGVQGHWDCSDFACRYLEQCGVVLPPPYDDPYTMTPNDLARWAGWIGARNEEQQRRQSNERETPSSRASRKKSGGPPESNSSPSREL